MSSPPSVLTLKQVFGLKGDVRDNIHYIDETNVLYPAGYNIILYNIEKKQQRFLPMANLSSALQAPINAAIQAAAPSNTAAQSNPISIASSSSSPGSGTISGSASAAAAASFSSSSPSYTCLLSDSVSVGDITALAISNPTKLNGTLKGKLLAVAERNESGRASVSLYDLNSLKRKGKSSLVSSEIQSKEFVSMCFSPDGKYLLTQSGSPDYTLIQWQWEKNKALQMARVSNSQSAPIYQCSYCPTDPSVICVSGNGILRFLHIEQNEFKSIPFSMGKREPQNYLCHCWVDDRILVGTDTGDILVFENAEFRGVLESSPSDGKSIDSIQAFSKGFVAGCDEGILYVFERDEKEIYKQSKSFQIDGNYVKIKNIAISPSEDNVICTLENNQAYVLGLSNSDILKSEEMNFEPLALPFHFLQITGLDVCIRKPLVATCGLDRSIRVWNYLQKSMECMKFFSEQPLSVSFHPSGLHLVAGFSDSLKLINILMDDLRPYKEFPIKNCREVEFSHGGQYFAAVNGNLIQIFSAYTFDQLASFNTHKAKVKSIHWIYDDSALISTALDGCIFITKIKDGATILVNKNKVNYLNAIYGADNKTYAVGADRTFRVFSDQQLTFECQSSSQPTEICMSVPRPPLKDRLIFVGTDNGTIRAFPLPLDSGTSSSSISLALVAGGSGGPSSISGAPGALAASSSSATIKYFDLQVHSGPISRMKVSADEQFLFVVGHDSCLSIFSIDSKRPDLNAGKSSASSGSGMMSPAAAAAASVAASARSRQDHFLPFAEEILVTKSDLEEKMNLLYDLQSRVSELTHHNELQLQVRENNYKEKLREVTERFHSELDMDKEKYKLLEEQKELIEQQFKSREEQLKELHRAKKAELNAHHANKVKQEKERYADLEAKAREFEAEYARQVQLAEEEFERAKKEIIEMAEQKLTDQHGEKLAAIALKQKCMGEFDETRNLIEQDAEQEIEELKWNYEKKFQSERMLTLKLKAQNALNKNKFTSRHKVILANTDKLSALNKRQMELYDEIEKKERDIRTHMKEIKERESTIGDKVHRIFELRKKNQELEKFRFVLDYKIAELKRQIQPRKLEMKSMSEQIGQMEGELKGYKKESIYLGLHVKELQLKMNGMDKELAIRTESRKKIDTQFKQFQMELAEANQWSEDPAKLKDMVKRIYQKYVDMQIEEAKYEAGAAAAQSPKRKGKDEASMEPDADSSSLDGPASPGNSSGLTDAQRDYLRQRHYLENCVDSLNNKLTKDLHVHKKDHMRIMSENIQLTKEINELRREIHYLRAMQKAKEENQLNAVAAGRIESDSSRTAKNQAKLSRTAPIHASQSPEGGLPLQLQIQQEQIRALKNQLVAYEQELDAIEGKSPTAKKASPINLQFGANPTPAPPASERPSSSGVKLRPLMGKKPSIGETKESESKSLTDE